MAGGDGITRWVPGLLLAALGCVLAWWTWGTWLDPVVDFGRELYVPWRLGEGDVLYRDIAWFNGPLSQYLNAAVFAVFGVGLRTIVLVNFVVIAAVTALLYRVALRFSDRLSATMTAGLFLVLFAFARGEYANFNWVCPYSHEITHGVALALAAFVALERWLATERGPWLWLAGLATGLVFLTKPEAFAATLLLAGGALLCAVRSRVLRRRHAGIWVAGVLPPPAIAFGLLAPSLGSGGAARALAGGWLYVFDSRLSGLLYYRGTMGTHDLGESLPAVLIVAGFWAAAAAPVVPAGLLLRRGGPAAVAAAVAIGAVTCLVWSWLGIDWEAAWVPLPLFVAVIGAVAARRSGGRVHPGRGVVLLAVLGLGLVAKVLLNVRVQHYGFALAVPGFVLIVLALLAWIPGWVVRRGGSRRVARIVAAGVLAIPVVGHWRAQQYQVGLASHTVGSGADAFRSDTRGVIVAAFAEYLRTLPESTTVVALPEGIALNYFARRVNPTPYVSFMPPEVLMFGERNMLDALRRDPPDHIALFGRPSVEYGTSYELFGRSLEYGAAIVQWVRANYRVDPRTSNGPEPLVPARIADNRFSLWLLHRR